MSDEQGEQMGFDEERELTPEEQAQFEAEFQEYMKQRYGPVELSEEDATPDEPRELWPTTWMAIRADSTEAVAQAVQLQDAQPCNWAKGQEITGKYGSLAFVTPPVEGWVYIGGRLPADATMSSADDPLLAWIRDLSRTFGEALFFGSDNSMPYATWARCKDGEIERAYAVQTDPEPAVLWNVGEPEEIEREYGVKGPAGFEGELSVEEVEENWLPYEEAVEAVAESWGPCIYSLGGGEPGVGLAGRLMAPWREMEEEDEEEGVEEEMSEEEQAAVLQEMEEVATTRDMNQLLELYCADKEMEVPEEVRARDISDLEQLAEAFLIIVKTRQPQLDEETAMQMMGITLGMSLKHYGPQLRPRA